MKRNSKLVLAFAVILLLLLAAWLAWHFIYTRDGKNSLSPNIKKASFRIEGFSARQTTLLAHVQLENPTLVDLVADSVTYQFYIDSVRLGESSNEKQIKLRRQDTTWVDLEMVFSSSRLFHTLDSLAHKHVDSVSYNVKGIVYNKIKNFEINRTWRGPLFHLINIKLSETKFDSLRHGHVYLGITLSMGNDNIFPVSFKDIAYKVSLDGGPWVEGRSHDIIKIAPHQVVKKSFPVQLPLKGAGKTGLHLLLDKKNTPYRLKLNFELNSDREILRSSKVSIDDSSRIGNILKLLHHGK